MVQRRTNVFDRKRSKEVADIDIEYNAFSGVLERVGENPAPTNETVGVLRDRRAGKEAGKHLSLKSHEVRVRLVDLPHSPAFLWDSVCPIAIVERGGACDHQHLLKLIGETLLCEFKRHGEHGGFFGRLFERLAPALRGLACELRIPPRRKPLCQQLDGLDACGRAQLPGRDHAEQQPREIDFLRSNGCIVRCRNGAEPARNHINKLRHEIQRTSQSLSVRSIQFLGIRRRISWWAI